MGKNATRGKAGKASSTGGKAASGGSGGKAPAAGSAHSLNLKNRGKDGKHSNQRSAATIKRLQMYRCVYCLSMQAVALSQLTLLIGKKVSFTLLALVTWAQTSSF